MSAAAVELTGTGTLTRLMLRRERVRVAVWVAAIPLLVLLTAASVKGLYPTRHDLDVAARGSQGNAAAIAFNGPALALDTVGGEVAFQTGTIGLVVVALLSIFMIGRQTRGEEEAGRTELVRALPTGRHATAAAALLVVTGMNAAVAAVVTLGLLALGLPATGSIVFGVSFFDLGLVFASFTTVAAQISENTRVVHGSTGAVLGAAFVVRALGDIGDGTASWFSPIGWVQKTRPYAGERWWPLLVAVACTAASLALASALAARRDLGAGLVPPRPSPSQAAPGLGRPLGLALRLQRGSLIGWSCAVFLAGVAYGWVADDVKEFIGDNDTMRKVIASIGGADITDAYLTRSLLTVALVGPVTPSSPPCAHAARRPPCAPSRSWPPPSPACAGRQVTWRSPSSAASWCSQPRVWAPASPTPWSATTPARSPACSVPRSFTPRLSGSSPASPSLCSDSHRAP